MQPPARWAGIASLMIVVTMAYMDRVNVSVLVLDASFLRHYSLVGDRAGQGLLMTLFLLGYGIAALLLTPIYEGLLGCRGGLLVSVFVWAALTAVSPLLSPLPLLLLARALLGAAEGPLFSLKVMFVAERFEAHERGKPNAVTSTGVSLGLAAGYPVVDLALHHFGWAGSFEMLAAINVGIGLPLVFFLVDGRPGPRKPSGKPSYRAIIASTVRAALSTKRLGSILLVEIFTLSYLWGSSFWLPAFLANDRHFALSRVGWLSAAPFLVSFCANLLGGAFVDRLSLDRLPIVFVMGGAACASCVMALFGGQGDAMTFSMLLGASAFWGLQSAAIPTLVQSGAPVGGIGTAYGIINGIGNLVASFMPLAMGSLMKHSVVSGFVLLVASQICVCLCGVFMLHAAPAGGSEDRRSLRPT